MTSAASDGPPLLFRRSGGSESESDNVMGSSGIATVEAAVLVRGRDEVDVREEVLTAEDNAGAFCLPLALDEGGGAGGLGVAYKSVHFLAVSS